MDFSTVDKPIYRLTDRAGNDVTLAEIAETNGEAAAMLTMAIGGIIGRHWLQTSGFTLTTDFSRGVEFHISDGNEKLITGGRPSAQTEQQIFSALANMLDHPFPGSSLRINPEAHTLFAENFTDMARFITELARHEDHLLLFPSDVKRFLEASGKTSAAVEARYDTEIALHSLDEQVAPGNRDELKTRLHEAMAICPFERDELAKAAHARSV